MKRRGILAALMMAVAAQTKGRAQDLFQALTGGTKDETILLLLDMKTDQPPEKDIALRVVYHGETIDILMSDVMNEIRSLNRYKP